MPSASPPGMQNRLSSSSSSSPPSPSLPSASSTTPRSSTAAPAAPTPASTAPADLTPSAPDASDSNTTPTPSAASTARRSNDSSNAPSTARRSPPSSSSASRPRFLSRLSLPLPLRSRNRNVADFHIRPHEPHRKYSPGDHVRGSVILAIVKPVRITHLTVALNGYVRVLKDPAVSAKTQAQTPTLPQGAFEKPQYHGHGLASLFQDEQVLSGDGRLDPGKYEFGFDLVFPTKSLPSSIDFERGAICYTIAATLTRPTTMAPTTSCDRKVTLVNKVDIGSVRPPSPRTIFLEPISKRTRRKRSTGIDRATPASSEATDIASEAGSADPSVLTEDSRDRTADSRNADQSDIRSEVSAESGHSMSTSGLSRSDLAQVASAKQQVVDDKTITATIALTRGGCLPGDTVSVRVTVQHIKRLKSLNGVIVTLFRQGKMESAPHSSLFSDTTSREELRRVEKNETFPRSRAGLAGLSLSSSGTTSVFRKDLDQNTAPLIVDPSTLQTSVTVSVKLPDDAFPTIKGVPGDMISFRYQVEVIVDLGGRLSNKFKGGGGQESRVGQGGGSAYDLGGNNFNPRRGGPITDTSPLRREKGVISVSMETVVGTTDSSRGRARTRVSPSSRTVRTALSEDDEFFSSDYSQQDDYHYGTPLVNGNSSNGYFSSQHQAARNYGHPPPHHPTTPGGPSQPYPYRQTNGSYGDETPAYVPPPQIPEQQDLSEKERVRLAETRLLPSQPPAGPSESSEAGPSAGPSSVPAVEPSAPSAPPMEDDSMNGAEDTPRLPHANPSSPQQEPQEGPSAPTHEDLSRPVEPQAGQDKLEQERQRLISEASAPPEFPPDVDRRMGGTSRRDMAPDAQPSAPMLHEGEADYDYQSYGAGAGPSNAGARDHNEQLPAYER